MEYFLLQSSEPRTVGTCARSSCRSSSFFIFRGSRYPPASTHTHIDEPVVYESSACALIPGAPSLTDKAQKHRASGVRKRKQLATPSCEFSGVVVHGIRYSVPGTLGTRSVLNMPDTKYTSNMRYSSIAVAVPRILSYHAMGSTRFPSVTCLGEWRKNERKNIYNAILYHTHMIPYYDVMKYLYLCCSTCGSMYV